MNIHIFDIDWTLCEEQWILSDKMISYLILLSKKDKVYLNTWRWYKSALNSIKNNSFLKENITFITENWSKFNEKIYNFSKKEIYEILRFLEINLEKIEYFDFWLNDKLYTFFEKNIYDENEFRRYFQNFLDLKYIILEKSESISMFYVFLKEKIIFNFEFVNTLFWKNDIIFTKNWIDKSNILEKLENYEKIFVYWNWKNDLSLFSCKKERKINIWIWKNKQILKLSDIKLSSYLELEQKLNILKNYSIYKK